MSTEAQLKPTPGSILWHDLTVPDAAPIRDFYAQVASWTSAPVPMKDPVTGPYDDYCMNTPDARTVAGVCHQRGPNTKIPPQWILYIAVDRFDERLQLCTALGGAVIDGPRGKPGSRFAIIRDPAGAHVALSECG